MEEGETATRDNPFDEQVKRQVDAHLKKEQRRLNDKRRMQSDDGSVIDILESVIYHIICTSCVYISDPYYLPMCESID